MTTDHEQNEDRKLTEAEQTASVQGAINAGRAIDARNARADKERQAEDDRIADDAVAKGLAEEKKYVDPSSPEVIANLERENAERHASEGDTIAPYDLVPAQFKDIADGYHEDAVAIAKDAGIPASEMEVMLHLAIGGAMDAVSKDMAGALSPGQIPGVDLSNQQSCRTYLDRKYGTVEAKIIVERAVAEFNRLPRKVQEYLDHNDGSNQLLTNSPHLLLALAAKNLGWTRLSKESAAKELAKLQGKKLSAFDLEKRRILGHIVSRGQSADNQRLTEALAAKKAAKPTPTAEVKIRGDLDKLRRSEAYWKREHPAHTETVKQVNALFAQLHPETR
jgi:hypothetical protein